MDFESSCRKLSSYKHDYAFHGERLYSGDIDYEQCMKYKFQKCLDEGQSNIFCSLFAGKTWKSDQQRSQKE
jgi:hypothetical protein